MYNTHPFSEDIVSQESRINLYWKFQDGGIDALAQPFIQMHHAHFTCTCSA